MAGLVKLILFVGICCMSPVDGGQCARKYYICGQGKCCCNGTIADCHGRRLNFVPDELPANTTVVLFNGNRLGNISSETFRGLARLNVSQLYVRENHIENIAADAFSGLHELSVLDMSKNTFTNKTALRIAFSSLKTRKNLTLMLDEIKIGDELRDDFFDGLSNIRVAKLQLGNNLLKSFNERAFEKLKYLKSLHLTKNRMARISGYSTTGLRSLEVLFLDKNDFAMHPPKLCRWNRTETRYPRLSTLDLGENLIRVIPYNAWSCMPRLRKLSLDANVMKVIRDNVFTPMTSLEVLNLSNLKGNLKLVERNALNSTSLIEINLSNNGMKFTPKASTKKNNIFNGCVNLRKLHLSHNNFEKMSTVLFTRLLSPLARLEYLDGVHLQLKAIPDGLLQTLPSLQVLNLDGNGIHTWNRSTFHNVTQLRTLSLQGNNLHTITSEQFPENLQKSLTKLSLADNPFACTCDNLWFRNWINDTVTRGTVILTSWPRRYKCSTPPAWHRKLLLSYQPTAESCRRHDQMVIVYATIGSFLLAFTIVTASVYRQRWYIRYWLHKLRRNRQRNRHNDSLLINDENTNTTPYDAYVIYNDEDVQLIRAHLTQLVEEKHNMRLCIRHRDSELGRSKVAMFADDMYASRSVIAVISRNFIRDPWCQFQLDVALDRQVALGRSCLLLAVLGDMDLTSLNKAWCVILTKTPSADWCTDEGDIRYTVFEQKLLKTLAER